MEIVEDRDDYRENEEDEEEKQTMMVGKHPNFPFHPFSCCSSSSQCQAPGVASQPNGPWASCQIHDDHRRLWLGSYGSRDDEAAAAKNPNCSSYPIGGGEEEAAARAGGGDITEREHMFDKVVTPSDVGKLNRLVIPKQHAEKYFPLDSSTNEKGLLLSFEDRTGKPWRFRYSYWNSSQSYVMTKGWSRFVKEKKLDAGDIVSFERGLGDIGKDRLYIDWKRRPDAGKLPFIHHHHPGPLHRSLPWGRLFFPSAAAAAPFPQLNYGYGSTVPIQAGPVFYLRPSLAGLQENCGVGSTDLPMVFDSVPIVHGKAAAAAKKLRLFGVNLECSSTDNVDILSSVASVFPQPPSLPPPPSSSPLQLRLYNGDPHTASASNLPRKPRQSLSFDLDL